jgi:hypothetical protein
MRQIRGAVPHQKNVDCAKSKELQILKIVLQIVTNELQNIGIGPE